MVQSYVIHLERSTARQDLVTDLLSVLPNCKIVTAVDGREMTEAARKNVAKTELIKPRYPFGLLPSEVGCFLSHRKAWQAIADSDADFGFIAEDDVAVSDGFENALALASQYGNETALIRFPMSQREKPDRSIAVKNGVHLFRPKEIGLTAALYLLGREAAKNLLAASETFDRPVDTWLQMRWETQVDSLTLWPSYIASAAPSHGGSTIQSKRTAKEEISRSWHRARYRAAITKLSKST